MATTRFFRSPSYQHADPARRIFGVGELASDADELAALLTTDPSPEVRIAAAHRCTNLGALAAAWNSESDPAVRGALASGLVSAITATQNADEAAAMLANVACTDEIRADVARRAAHPERRKSAIAAIREEATLVDLALTADHTETRMAAADRIHTTEGLHRLAEAAKDKDRGVARLARKRIDAMADSASHAAEADAIVAQLEALAANPDPVLTTLIDLNRRWQALKLDDDSVRLARCEAARQTLQARFEREHEEQRARSHFDNRLNEWLARTDAPATADELASLIAALAALRDEGARYADALARSRLDEADRRVERWAQDLNALAAADALVVEAEQLAAGTSIDNANLPERWQALARDIRTPALTRRFEAALIVVEQRRLAQIRAAEQEASLARQQVHGLLHTAEQALAAGQLHAARTATDEIKSRKSAAGLLPKPTLQRLGRLAQQLTELERWESFGQQQARVRLCERAEAAAAPTLDVTRLAAEVQTLRNEWKALDAQHAEVPKALWERFDRACEKAYAPAARHFAQQAELRKQARTQREDFIALAATHAPTLLVEPRDWRAIERWLRETDVRWRDGALGSVEPKAWKSFDARLREALAPLRDALAAARDQAKAQRVVLIDEVTALAAKAMDRDVPSQVKAIQARWQTHAKELALAQRDERALWERFRAACDAVFQAREAKRKQEDDVKHAGRRALEELCVAVEQLATATDKDEQQVRRTLRELSEQWKQATRGSDPSLRGVEARFAKARATVETAMTARSRARESAVWQVLASKEQMCEELDRAVQAHAQAPDVATTVEHWTALPGLPPAWEKSLLARRDAGLRALADDAARAPYEKRIVDADAERRETLLALEMQLGLPSPPEMQSQRLALQVKQLRDRFQSAASAAANTPGERLLGWCTAPGVADAVDRQRIARIFSAMEHVR